MIVVRELHPLQVNKEATGALLLANTGTGIWLAAVTLGKIHTLQSGNKSYSLNTFSWWGTFNHQVVYLFSGEKAFATLSYGWLWAGLYFILVITMTITFMFCQCFERHCFHKTDQVIIVGVTSLFGYIEVITSTLVSIKPSYARCLLQRVYYDKVSSQAKWIDLSVYYYYFTPGSSPSLPFLCWPSSSSLILFSLHRSVVFHLICWFCWNCFFLQGGIHIVLLSFILFVDFAETVFCFQGGIHIYHLLIIIIIKMIIIIIIIIIFREESTSTTCSPPTSPPGPLSSSLSSPWVAVILLSSLC